MYIIYGYGEISFFFFPPARMFQGLRRVIFHDLDTRSFPAMVFYRGFSKTTGSLYNPIPW